ncbi:hypothetical protein CCM_02153 [Cordyceps militaris CM01]|uniref:Uncharacterized protein n=1 Tax=Cordyceps militaris (strain CM01) TaxID=983644 RepID=G3J841_CORMM|nr:uncharacterized protein CCM_02153 [Cordyceps militaris CM01]EGX93883.1 hypothetical protein CCM_02153 [Cordyceps militaris CM01]
MCRVTGCALRSPKSILEAGSGMAEASFKDLTVLRTVNQHAGSVPCSRLGPVGQPASPTSLCGGVLAPSKAYREALRPCSQRDNYHKTAANSDAATRWCPVPAFALGTGCHEVQDVKTCIVISHCIKK